MLGQEGAGMAAWYACDAELEKKLAGVVVKIDEHFVEQKCLTPPTRVSNRVFVHPENVELSSDFKK
jgi:hypothetical protein